MRRTRRDTPRVGLVLGAGGTVGAAYHAGVLFSIEHHTGFDPRDAAQVVGTSAGSLVGALLRSGVSAEDLVRLARRDPGLPVPSHLRGLQQASVADAPSVFDMLLAIRPPTLGAVADSMRHRSMWPWLLSWSRSARYDLQPVLEGLDGLHDPDPSGTRDAVDGYDGCGPATPWPPGDLRICAASAADGGRRVLDASSGISLSRAVAASCAVPGLFRPQRVRGERLVDGGVWSVTNVDALDVHSSDHPVDEVWIVAPMAGSTFRRPSTTLVHRRIRQTLHRELETLPSGMPVRIFSPTRESSEVMGLDLMSEDRTAETILAGFLEAGDPRRSA